MTDPEAVVLNESNSHKTILFPGNKGPKSITWEQTKWMAFDLWENSRTIKERIQDGYLPEKD